MIPHAPPIRFDVNDGDVILPLVHPLCVDGAYPAVALLELAAQLAGRAASLPGGGAEPGHRGMLVEVDDCTILTPSVPAGSRLRAEVTLERRLGGLHRFRVTLDGVLSTGLTLRIG